MDTDRWSLISGIYAAARDKEPAQQAAFLDQACAGDPALRAEVETLLAHEFPSAAAIDVLAAELASAPYPQPGATLGTYQLGALIGVGGMGQVYRAHDAELGRDVAIKFLPPVYASDPDRRARFEREARVLASLNHPHIAAIYGVAELGAFRGLVLELVEGDTLADRLERISKPGEGLPLGDALPIAIQIADALDAAHAKGIIHRDLKPSNVKIGADGRVKVLDFGLAKAIGTEQDIPTGLSSPDGQARDSSAIAGTAPYMSPEQQRGHPVDQRTDVWAFGCVLFEMLCGRRAFASGWNVATPGPGAPDWSALPQQTSAELAGHLRRLLEPDPARRVSSLNEARTVLQRCQAALATPPLSRRSRAVLVAAAAALVAAVSLGVWRLASAPAPATQSAIDSIAVLPLRNLTGDDEQQYLSDGLTEAVMSSLTQIRSIGVTARGSVMRYRNTTESAPAIARRLGVDAIVDGSLQRAGGRILARVQLTGADGSVRMPARDFDAAESDLLTLQATVARTIADEIRAQVSPAERQRLLNPKPVHPDAYTQYLLGRHNHWKQDEASLRRAVGHFERAIALQPDYALAYSALVMSFGYMRNFAFAMEDAAARERAAAARALELDPVLAEAHAAMGTTMFDDWDLNAALTHFSKARELNPNSIDTCGCFTMLLSALGRHAESISLIEHTLKLDPLSNTTHFEAGLVYHFARRYADAERHVRLSLELAPEQYPAHIVLADVMKATGRAEEAIKVLDRPPFQRSAFMATAYAAAGRRREATALLDELIRGRGPFEYLNIALTYLHLGDRGAALEWLAKAIDTRQGYMRWVGVIPFLDPLRDDPRFQAIIAPLKLPAADEPLTR